MQIGIFGEPSLKPTQSQWHTPLWLSQRMASWVPRGARILEPSCGGGNVIEGLLRAGHRPVSITGVELDPEWAECARLRHPNVEVITADFLLRGFERDSFDVVVGNFPFEDNQHLSFTVRALELAPVVIGVFPAAFQFSRERLRALWMSKGVVKRRAVLPLRVDYGGDQSPSFDSVVLEIHRRTDALSGSYTVEEMLWTP